MQSHSGPELAASPGRRLTPREREIAELVRCGLSNMGIAKALGIPAGEVAHHLDSAYAKLGINSRSALASAVIAVPNLTQAYRGQERSGRESAMTAAEYIEYMLGAGKPDPLSARTLSELEDCLLSLWEWAGRPSSRKLAARSDGAFSHATVSKLIHQKPGKPALKLEYVLGFVRACDAGQAEQQRWITAWRIVTQGPGNHRRPPGNVQAAPKASRH